MKKVISKLYASSNDSSNTQIKHNKAKRWTLVLGLLIAGAISQPSAASDSAVNNSTATDFGTLELLLLDNDQILLYSAEQDLVLAGTGSRLDDYSQYQLSAWQLTSIDFEPNEASTGTGATEPPQQEPPDDTQPSSASNGDNGNTTPQINEAAQGSGIVLSSANWGTVEVLYSCEYADLIMHQKTADGALEEVMVGRFSTNQC